MCEELEEVEQGNFLLFYSYVTNIYIHQIMSIIMLIKYYS